MQRFLIQCVNCVLLAIIFFGIPAVTGMQFGNWQISSIPLARRLMFGGLALAAAGNAVAALAAALSLGLADADGIGVFSRFCSIEW